MPFDAEEIRIRLFQPGDLATLREMTVEAFQGVSIDQNIERQFGVIQGRDWRFRKGQHVDADALRDPAGIFVAVFSDDRIAGFVSTWCDRDAGVGHIPNLVVAAGIRGKGLGRRLVAHAADHFRRQGMTHARIETLDQNPIGGHLYPSLGFREVARQIHFCADLDDLPCARSNEAQPPPHGSSL